MGKTLFISDFDDTLAETDAKIYLTRDGKRFEMTPAEYAVYQEEPGDQFDFSDFDKLINPRPIKRFVKMLQNATQNPKVDKVTILTARGHTRPVAQFLKKFGVKGKVMIAALGSSDPDRKARYIEKHIQQGFDRIAFIDDSPKNVEAVNKLKDKYPEVRLLVHQAKETAEEPESHETPAEDKDKVAKSSLEAQIDSMMVRNPETKRDIRMRTALSYDKQHPAYRAAMQVLQGLRNK